MLDSGFLKLKLVGYVLLSASLALVIVVWKALGENDDISIMTAYSCLTKLFLAHIQTSFCSGLIDTPITDAKLGKHTNSCTLLQYFL